MPRYAVIDVGTNSVKFHVGEHDTESKWTTVVDRAEVTRLGEGLAATGGEFSPEAMDRTAAAIAGMAAEAKEKGATTIVAVGTMGMRTAHNREAFIGDVERRSGVRIEIISGAEEGRLAYLAVKSGLGLGDGTMVIFDTGGGAASSPSVVGRRSPSNSASTSARSASRRRTASREWCLARTCDEPWTRWPPTSRASTGPRRPTPWSAWGEPSPTSRP